MDLKHFGGEPEQSTARDDADTAPRSWGAAMRKGLSQRCPRCGSAPLYQGFLTVRPACGNCGLDFSGHRADDLPPFLTIVVVGHLVIPCVLLVERLYAPPLVATAIVWSIVASALCLALLPRIKGAVIGIQWAHEMHGFGEGGDWAEHPAPGPDESEEARLTSDRP